MESEKQMDLAILKTKRVPAQLSNPRRAFRRGGPTNHIGVSLPPGSPLQPKVLTSNDVHVRQLENAEVPVSDVLFTPDNEHLIHLT